MLETTDLMPVDCLIWVDQNGPRLGRDATVTVVGDAFEVRSPHTSTVAYVSPDTRYTLDGSDIPVMVQPLIALQVGVPLPNPEAVLRGFVGPNIAASDEFTTYLEELRQIGR
jgi:hypothetical protein